MTCEIATLINEIINEMKIDKNLLSALLSWALDKPYTAAKDAPNIMIVTEKVMNFLFNF